MAETSRVEAAIDALLLALRARPALSSVDVVDGPPLDWEEIKLAVPEQGDGTRYLFVGAVPDDDTSATGTQDFNAAGAVSRDETFDVVCSALGFDGSGDIRKARELGRELKAELERTIRADPSLGGAVLYCRVSTLDRLDQMQTDRGVSAVYVFRVTCRAYLS